MPDSVHPSLPVATLPVPDPVVIPLSPTPPPPKPAVLDPFVAKIAKSMGMVIDPEPAQPIPEKPKYEGPMSLGELGIVSAIEKTKLEKAMATNPAVLAATVPPPVSNPVPKPVVNKPASRPGYTDINTSVTQPITPPEPVRQPEIVPQAPDDTAAALKLLNDEEREEYELAVFAEKHNPDRYKDLAAKQLDYFKKAAEFSTQHPDTEPDSEEFQDFLERHRPKLTNHERQKLFRTMVEETASANSKAEIAKVTRESEAKINQRFKEIELKPIIDQRTQEFLKQILDKPEGIEGFEEQVVKDALAFSPEELYASYPIEGAIVLHHIQAARTLNELTSGLRLFEPKNPMDAWLARFLHKQEETFTIRSQPEDKVLEGRQWIPRADYMDMQNRDPNRASNYWCFSDDQLQGFLGANAQLSVENRRKQFLKAGLTKVKIKELESTPPQILASQPNKQPTPSVVIVPDPVTLQTSPKAGLSALPSTPSATSGDPSIDAFIRRRAGL